MLMELSQNVNGVVTKMLMGLSQNVHGFVVTFQTLLLPLSESHNALAALQTPPAAPATATKCSCNTPRRPPGAAACTPLGAFRKNALPGRQHMPGCAKYGAHICLVGCALSALAGSGVVGLLLCGVGVLTVCLVRCWRSVLASSFVEVPGVTTPTCGSLQ